MKNVFTYDKARGSLVKTFYKLLVKGCEVSYEDVLTDFFGQNLSNKLAAYTEYKTLKHVIPEVVDEFKKNGFDILQIKNGRSTKYKYIGADKDPLKNIKFQAILKERYDKIADYINKKKPFKITYLPFDRNKMEIIFHPHLLRTYNGRYFALGVSEKEGCEPFRKFVIALDRIYKKDEDDDEEKEIRYIPKHSYIPPEHGEYDYLANLVGVSFEKNAELTTIRLRALDKYTFGRLTKKPLHNSQKIVLLLTKQNGLEYGEVEITVYPNVELLGQILSYGSYLQVVSPESYRNTVAEEIKKALQLYENGD